MFGIGGGEVLVVALVALILFGNEDLPKNMRKMVKAWNDFRGVTNDLQRSWLDVRDQVTRDLLTEQPPHSDAQNNPAPSDASHTAHSGETHPVESVDSAGENPALDHSAESETPALPVIQPAAGTLAQGQIVAEEEKVSVSQASDKST